MSKTTWIPPGYRPAAGSRGPFPCAVSWLFAVLLVCVTAAAHADSQKTAPEAGRGSSEILFESRPPGIDGGGLLIGNIYFPGHTFRLTEPALVTGLGTGNLSASSEVSVFTALYHFATPFSTPDVVSDSNLVEATLVDVPTGSPADVAAPVSVTLEPGWYSILTGTGRHGATAGNFVAGLTNTATATTPQSHGPYSIRSDTNHMTLQGSTSRFFIEGETLPAPEPAATEFLAESAGPAAWGAQVSTSVNATTFRGMHVEVTDTTRAGEVGAWMRSGSGQIFAALVALDEPGALPPFVGSPAFTDAVVGSTLINVGSAPDAYTGDFAGLELAPGHYALVYGSGLFGASGSASIMYVDDEIVSPDSLLWTGSFWTETQQTFRMWVAGTVDPFSVAPDPLDFGEVVIGNPESGQLNIAHQVGDGLEITDIEITGGDAAQFELQPDAADCITTLPADGQCVFTVNYDPQTAGSHTATVQISSDGEPAVYPVGLTGSAVVGVPELEFSPAVIDFGGVEYQTTSPIAGAMLNNIGNGDAGGLTFTLSGTDYALVANDCGDTLAAKTGCSVDLTFTPSASGSIPGNLVVTGTDGVSATLDLTGTGLEVPAILVLPESIDFGDTNPGEPVTSDFVIVENEGGGILDLGDLTVGGPQADDFQTTPGVDECSNQGLAGGEFCHFTLDFDPSAPGVRRAILQIDSNDPAAPHFIDLSGSHDVILHDQFEAP